MWLSPSLISKYQTYVEMIHLFINSSFFFTGKHENMSLAPAMFWSIVPRKWPIKGGKRFLVIFLILPELHWCTKSLYSLQLGFTSQLSNLCITCSFSCGFDNCFYKYTCRSCRLIGILPRYIHEWRPHKQ